MCLLLQVHQMKAPLSATELGSEMESIQDLYLDRVHQFPLLEIAVDNDMQQHPAFVQVDAMIDPQLLFDLSRLTLILSCVIDAMTKFSRPGAKIKRDRMCWGCLPGTKMGVHVSVAPMTVAGMRRGNPIKTVRSLSASKI